VERGGTGGNSGVRMNDIPKIQDAIRQMHGCASTFIESVPIEERFNGQLVWGGSVLVFDLQGHPKASRCFAWSHLDGKDDGQTRYVAVLNLPPVDTPRKAVQAAIVSQLKSGR
jgi:hypothetical protein